MPLICVLVCGALIFPVYSTGFTVVSQRTELSHEYGYERKLTFESLFLYQKISKCPRQRVRLCLGRLRGQNGETGGMWVFGFTENSIKL